MQNRESKAVRLKLDELIRALKSADNSLLTTEDLTEQQLKRLVDVIPAGQYPSSKFTEALTLSSMTIERGAILITWAPRRQ